MNMDPEQENFESLRRVLVLKRYEQPPPGYFDRFSRRVMARIEAGEEMAEERAMVLPWAARWLQQLWMAFQAKPMLAGAFGLLVCGLLVGGIAYSDSHMDGQMGSQPMVFLPAPELSQPERAEVANNRAMEHPLFNRAGRVDFPSAEGAVTLQARPCSLFQEFKESQRPLIEPASWNSANGN